MDIYAKIQLDRISVDPPRGEELDEELVSALLSLDVEGYEVTKAEVSRTDIAKEEKRQAQNMRDLNEQNKKVLAHYVNEINEGRGQEPDTDNPEITVAQAFAFLVERFVIE